MSVNVLDQNGNLKKIAHGFSESKFNTFRSDVISNIEMTDTASKDYAVGDFLIMANGQLAQVTSPIYQDMTISLSNVRLTTVEDMIAAKADPADIPDVSKYQKIFTGTLAEWNQLTTAQKTAYDLANITDDLGTEAGIVDAVTDGDMRAVTSNAVHDALESKISTSETVGLVKNDGSIDTKSYAEKVTNGTENNLAGLDQNGNLKDAGWSSDKTTTSATGNPISLSGLKSNQLAINPIITFEPIQAGSGTPSPSNVRAISGYDKIEVLSSKNVLHVLGQNPSNGYVNGYFIDNNGDLPSAAGFNGYVTEYSAIKPNTTYTLTVGYDGLAPSICFYDINKNFIEGIKYNQQSVITFTTASNVAYCRASVANTAKYKIYLEEGTTPTAYNKTTDLSESLGQTVAGGKWDVRSGEFDITWHKVKFGDLTVSLGFSTGTYSCCKRRSLPSDAYAKAVGYGQLLGALCSIRQELDTSYGSQPSSHTSEVGTANGGFAFTYDGLSVVIYDNDTSLSEAQYDARYNDIEIWYPLATSKGEIQLTPHEISLLSQYAYVSTNGTTITLDYHNGEMASLSDVSQLGETVNELGDKVDDISIITSLIPSAAVFKQIHTGANNATIRVTRGIYFIFGAYRSGSETTKDGYAIIISYNATSYIRKRTDLESLLSISEDGSDTVLTFGTYFSGFIVGWHF